MSILRCRQQYEIFHTVRGLVLLNMEAVVRLGSINLIRVVFLIIEAADRATRISWSPTCRVSYNYSCATIRSYSNISALDIVGLADNLELVAWWNRT